ncbi:PH domain-containing protein [Jeotgalibacillus malaysiensis]|uniref:PH domain-containing protein n=1 Tax=Jeotgalibacillus malaysiensis TaxID=1508404 RepID=UPI00384CF91E
MSDNPKRYHPSWLVFEYVSFLKNAFFFILFLFILRGDVMTGWILWAKIIFILFAGWTIIHILLKWFFHTYQINNNSIALREGVFVKNHRVVPFERIQNHQTNTNFLHRLFKLTSLTLETGTSDSESSIKFSVITHDEARMILKKIEEKDAVAEAEAEAEEVVDKPKRTVYFRSTKKDTIKAALTSFSFLAIFPLLSAAYFQVNDFFDLEETTLSAFEYFKAHIGLLALLFIVAMLLSVVIGYIQTVVKYGNYVISADDERIYIEKGVWNTSTFSIQKDKVQAIKIEQPLIKRLLNMVEIKLISAGGLGEEKLETNALYPFMAKREAYELVNTLLPAYHIEEEMKRLPRKVLLLKLLTPYYGTLVVGAGLFFFQREWLWITGVIFVLAILSRILDYLFTSYLRHGEFIQTRKGGFSNETLLTRRARIEEIEVQHSWIQRKFDVASLKFSNRAKPVFVSELAYLPKEDVAAFYVWYGER